MQVAVWQQRRLSLYRVDPERRECVPTGHPSQAADMPPATHLARNGVEVLLARQLSARQREQLDLHHIRVVEGEFGNSPDGVLRACQECGVASPAGTENYYG